MEYEKFFEFMISAFDVDPKDILEVRPAIMILYNSLPDNFTEKELKYYRNAFWLGYFVGIPAGIHDTVRDYSKHVESIFGKAPPQEIISEGF